MRKVFRRNTVTRLQARRPKCHERVSVLCTFSEEEAIVVAFRRHTLLSLDDCLYALQPTIPHLTRSSLHRCLQRHGIGRLAQIEGDKPAKKKFKSYPIGFFHIDIAEVQTAEGKHGLPAGTQTRSFVEVGGLMSYGADGPDIFRQSALFVPKILQGGHAANIPVEQPTRFDLAFNLKTAKALGLTVPPSFLARAD